MEDKAFLLQQIEFLEFQLEDAKTREIQQKSMYETMIKSLTGSNLTPNDDDSSIKVKEIQLEFEIERKNLNEKINLLEKNLENLASENTNLKNELISCKNEYLVQKISLEEEVERKNSLLQKLKTENQSLEEKNLKFEEKISFVTKELEISNTKHSEELFRINQENNSNLEELKAVYIGQQKYIINKYSHLESENFSKSACTYITIICNDLETSAEKLKNLQKVLEKILKDTKNSLSSIITQHENQVSLLNSKNPKEKLDLTEKILDFNSSTHSYFENFKSSLNSLRSILTKILEKQKILKSKIDSKNSEIDSLKRAINIRSSEVKENNYYIEEIIRKDNEISSLKKIIGTLRENDGEIKPPLYAPSHKRSKTLPPPFKLQIQTNFSSPDFEVEGCSNHKNASTDRQIDSKNEIYLKKIGNLRLRIMKLKNQRDRAKILSEKMLLELKEKKVELALIQENDAEQRLLLIHQIKGICGYLQSLSVSVIVPKIVKQDIYKVLNHYSKYLNM